MLTITIQGEELWDDDAEIFRYTDSTVLEFEHSLVSLSKWEAKFHKQFLTPDKRSEEEQFGYVQAMLMTPNVPDEVLYRMNEDHIRAIDEYINNPMTGTIISNLPQAKKTGERISAELIYYWMNEYKIPYEARSWHLNQLFTLIKVHYAKTQKPQKMNGQQQRQSMAELNAQRKAKLGTSG